MGRRGPASRPPIERFSNLTEQRDNGCSEWIGCRTSDGYGQFMPAGRASNAVKAHRWSYEYHVGPIPPGLQVDHLCRNRACVNPAHLEPVTPRENTLRSECPAAVNAKKTHCLRGHPLSGENLYIAPSSGKRQCRTCQTERAAAKRRAA